MKFAGFDRSALEHLERLPSLDAAGYARCREALNRGLIAPARALVGEVARDLDAPLTTSRGSVSPGFQVRFRIPLPREAERPESRPGAPSI
jgi:hypothetical protein